MSVIELTKKSYATEVAVSDKPVLIDFSAVWCGPCRMVAPIVEEIANENPDIKVCKVDVDKEPELASMFGIISIPTLAVIKNGKVTSQTVGFRPKNAIMAMLKG